MTPNGKPRVYFFCLPQGEGNKPAYQYPSIVLAEGLKKLGVPVYANLNYWKRSLSTDDLLFEHDPEVKPEDCDLVVVPCQWRTYGRKYPEVLFQKNRKFRSVLIDVCDGLFSPAFEEEARVFDVVLKQKTSGITYPDNCKYPWVFGVADHLMELIGDVPPFSARNKSVTVNFRHKHALRDLGKKNFIDKIGSRFEPDATYETLKVSYAASALEHISTNNDLFFVQSGGRHHFNYLARMKHAQACAAFGGNFMFGGNYEQNKFIHLLSNYFVYGRGGGKIKLLLEFLSFQLKHTYHIFQWDSWRFWESLMCGCITMHVNFETYGVQLPVMPQNWKHYVGVDLKNANEAVDRLLAASEQELSAIAQNGKQWAMENYSSVPTAKRFLSYFNY